MELDTILKEVSPIEGWFSDQQMRFVYPYIHSLLPLSTMVEIGTFSGRSTLFFRLTNENIHIITIDPRVPYIANGNLITPEKQMHPKVLEYDHIISLTGTSVSIGKMFTGHIDLMFIDGDHTYEEVKNDCETWLPKLERDVIVIFHDYEPTHDGVIRAVDEQIEKGIIEKIDVSHGICITKTV